MQIAQHSLEVLTVHLICVPSCDGTSTLTGILLHRAFNKSNRPESNKQEREEGKEEEADRAFLCFYVADLRRGTT